MDNPSINPNHRQQVSSLLQTSESPQTSLCNMQFNRF